MKVAVAVMDRAEFTARTDIIVVVDPDRRSLLWVPRDLWCECLEDRINTAFRRGGSDLLRTALGEHGIFVDATLCLSRTASENALARVRVMVPVPFELRFDYPQTPTSRIEDGSKTVVFSPPIEVLAGERVHQWIGGRSGHDLHRIGRQQVLLRRLLEQGFDFGRAIIDRSLVAISDSAVLETLAQVEPTWQLDVVGDLAPQLINGDDVLVRRPNRAPDR